jgi:mannose-6-phosphate isomerase
MLTYNAGAPVVLDGESVDTNTTRYVPPFDEFMLEIVTVGMNESYTVSPSPGPCVYLVMKGGGVVGDAEAKRGSVLFAAAGDATAIAAGDTGATLYRAMINSRVYA